MERETNQFIHESWCPTDGFLLRVTEDNITFQVRSLSFFSENWSVYPHVKTRPTGFSGDLMPFAKLPVLKHRRKQRQHWLFRLYVGAVIGGL